MPKVMKITDENGTVVATREYDAFGNVLSETGTWRSRFGFHPNWIQLKDGGGRFYIPPGGRIYDTVIGRFLQRDPIRGLAGGYTFATNDPVGKVDPDAAAPTDPQQIRRIQDIVGDTTGDPAGYYGTATNEAVRAYQEQLKKAGLYHGEVDGDWGSLTEAAHTQYVLRRIVPLIRRVKETLQTLMRSVVWVQYACCPEDISAVEKMLADKLGSSPTARQLMPQLERIDYGTFRVIMARVDKMASQGFFTARAIQAMQTAAGLTGAGSGPFAARLSGAAGSLRAKAATARASAWQGVAGRHFAKGAEAAASRLSKAALVAERASIYLGAAAIGMDLALLVTAKDDQEMLDHSRFLAADIAVTSTGIAGTTAAGAFGISGAALGTASGIGAVVVLAAGLAMIYYEYKREKAEERGQDIACDVNKKLVSSKLQKLEDMMKEVTRLGAQIR